MIQVFYYCHQEADLLCLLVLADLMFCWKSKNVLAWLSDNVSPSLCEQLSKGLKQIVLKKSQVYLPFHTNPTYLQKKKGDTLCQYICSSPLKPSTSPWDLGILCILSGKFTQFLVLLTV